MKVGNLRSYARIAEVLLAFKSGRTTGLPHPYRFIMNVTGACNSLCQTCDWGRDYISGKYKTREELTIAEYEALFTSVPDLCWLTLGGGEPTMRQDFVEIVVAANKRMKTLMGVDFSTNGLTPKVVERVVRRILSETDVLLEVGVSLDGAPELHDFIRGVKGNWNRCMETYRILAKMQEQHPRLGTHFNYTLSGLNTGRLPDLMQAIKRAGVTLNPDLVSVSFANVGYAFAYAPGAGFAIRDRDAAVSDVQYLLESTSGWSPSDAVRSLRRGIKRTYLALAIERYLKNPHKMVIPCSALVTTSFIDANGNVFPCTIWGKKLGNLREAGFDFDKIWNSELARTTRIDIAHSKCPVCWSGCESTQSILAAFPSMLPTGIRATIGFPLTK